MALHILRPQPPWRVRPIRVAFCGCAPGYKKGRSPAVRFTEALPTVDDFRTGRGGAWCRPCWDGAKFWVPWPRRPLTAFILGDSPARDIHERELLALVELARAHRAEYEEIYDSEATLAALAQL